MKNFKTESKRMLELMINSVYTNKEIFLRELISNASDALDKLRFISLTTQGLPSEYKIELSVDKTARTLTISDNGIGMDKDELEENLGTIAKSGTYALKSEERDTIKETEAPKSKTTKKGKGKTTPEPTAEDLIGQFGVGFYSIFMVAKSATVVSRKYNADSAYMWTSDGVEGYDVTTTQKDTFGTTITLTLKDKGDPAVDKLLDANHITSLVKKYSDYIRYPVMLDGKTVNSMIPIWRKSKSEAKPADYDEFYKTNYRDFTPPLKVFTASIEGAVTYKLLAFVPSRAPFDFYTKEHQKGLALYTNSVLIMQKCEELLPDYLAFIKGVVDSGDLSLNISREMLQQDKQLKAIATSLEKKLLTEFKKMLISDRETYEKFFDEFGLAFKHGAYENFGINKDKLQDLLLFKTSKEDKYSTLSEYTSRCADGQDNIYYAAGANLEAAKRVPQAVAAISRGNEVLFLTNPVDEFLLKTLGDYAGKKFVSVTTGDITLQSDEDKEEVAKATEKNADLLSKVKEELKDSVKDVVFSKSMGNFASSLRNDGEISIEMERILSSMPGATPFAVPKILELNPAHPLITILASYIDNDSEAFTALCNLLLNQSRILAGSPLENSTAFIEDINKLLCKK